MKKLTALFLAFIMTIMICAPVVNAEDDPELGFSVSSTAA